MQSSHETRDDGRSQLQGWRAILASASTEEEILEFVRGYLAMWGTQELSTLPAGCRPGRIRDAEDLNRWSWELASSHCARTFNEEGRAVLEEMLVFATRAAAHLAEVQALQQPQAGND